MNKEKNFWTITAILVIFIISIIISHDLNKVIMDYREYEKDTIVQTSNAIKVNGVWYSYDEWHLRWSRNSPVLTKKGTHGYLGSAETAVGILCGFIAFATGMYAYYLTMERKEKKKK